MFGEPSQVQGICLPRNESMCKKTRVRLGREHSEFKYHYVIDAVWLGVDLVHIICFPHFEASYRMFHSWEQAMEKVFTREIKNLWYHLKICSAVLDA